MCKRVILHIGFHKTGSSALQAYFSERVMQLAGVGLAYPNPDPPSVVAVGGCTGNIIQIMYKYGFQGVRSSIATYKDFEHFTSQIKATILAQPQENVLLSSEYLSDLTPRQVNVLAQAMSEFDVTIVCFVRDPFDYILSVWKQEVKTRLIPMTIDEFIRHKNGKFSMFAGFKNYINAFADVRVLRYEKSKRNLGATFLGAIDFPLINPEPSPRDERIHNPSLTFTQAMLCVGLAKAGVSADFAHLFSKEVSHSGRRDSVDYYDRELHASILSDFGDIIDEINAKLDVADCLSLTPRPHEHGSPEYSSDDLAALFSLLSEATNLENSERRPFHSRFSKLPAKFNDRAYLKHNPDVAETGMSPKEHYEKFGKNEGRRYKYF